MAETKIEWTATTLSDGSTVPGFSFNPWVGCTKVSPACDHCYAESWAKRSGLVQWGNHQRRRTSEANWRKPVVWDREACLSGVRRKVFCASLADVFDNQVDPQWRVDLFRLIGITPYLDWLLLTKRPQNIAKMLPSDWVLAGQPPTNVWLGTTVENQEEADRRIPHLLEIPARRKFLSCEPLLGPIDFKKVPGFNRYNLSLWNWWVICGGESGPNARLSHTNWFRLLRDQCAVAQVPFFHKQNGEWIGSDQLGDLSPCLDVSQCLESEMPGEPRGDGLTAVRVGKKASGALLDGVEHKAMPA